MSYIANAILEQDEAETTLSYISEFIRSGCENSELFHNADFSLSPITDVLERFSDEQLKEIRRVIFDGGAALATDIENGGDDYRVSILIVVVMTLKVEVSDNVKRIMKKHLKKHLHLIRKLPEREFEVEYFEELEKVL